ncbi:MAG: hypothetical protein ACLVD7_09525 [[Clostridium] leptum]
MNETLKFNILYYFNNSTRGLRPGSAWVSIAITAPPSSRAPLLVLFINKTFLFYLKDQQAHKNIIRIS